jgi:hypothetical protein
MASATASGAIVAMHSEVNLEAQTGTACPMHLHGTLKTRCLSPLGIQADAS